MTPSDRRREMGEGFMTASAPELGVKNYVRFVAMDLAKGHNLGEVIQRDEHGRVHQSLTWDYVGETFDNVYGALNHFQRKGVVHGDVRAKNIVGGQLVDLDQLCEEGDQEEVVSSNDLSYLAPEELKENPTWVYIFALALMLKIVAIMTDFMFHDITEDYFETFSLYFFLTGFLKSLDCKKKYKN